jgi:hypothetical protein
VLLLKSRSVIASAIIVTTLVFAACSEDSASKNNEQIKEENCSSPKVNPNGDSELALLMRSMTKNFTSVKAEVVKGNLPGEFPKEILTIHTAKPTDENTKKESFIVFADNYIKNATLFYTSNNANLKQNYNNVITSCYNCHSEHCPGPLTVISKLKLP